jgi:hypothetical protein
MRHRLRTVLVYFGFLEDRTATASAPPTTFVERFLYAFVFVGCLVTVSALFEGDLAEAAILAACVLVLLAIGLARRRRERDRA